MPIALAAGEITLASLDTLIAGIKSAVTWIFGLFATIVNVITSNDLLLYPVLLSIVIAVVGLLLPLYVNSACEAEGHDRYRRFSAYRL